MPTVSPRELRLESEIAAMLVWTSTKNGVGNVCLSPVNDAFQYSKGDGTTT